jgi:UDP-glucose:(heptosyl)LPS alpha-1,3-glucosyltransferase
MTNSKLVKRQITEHYNVPSKKIIVIYNGIDTLRFNPEIKEKYRTAVREKHGIQNKELLLFFVSNDFKLKGLQLILNAMLLLGKRKIKLMVAGNDNKKPYLKWAANNGLEKHLIFLGHKKDIEKYYAACDVFVLPTLYDACANVCIESMACGIPVITTKTNGACELIENGHNGYILETKNAEELASRIDSLEVSPERSRMGQNGASIASRFTMEKHISEVLNLYDMVRKEDNT